MIMGKHRSPDATNASTKKPKPAKHGAAGSDVPARGSSTVQSGASRLRIGGWLGRKD